MRRLVLLMLLACLGCLTPKAMQDAQAHRHMGVAYLTEGNAGGAITEFKAAVKANAWDDEAWHELALAWFASGRHEEAEACFKKAISMAPDFSQAKLNYGGLLLDEKRWDEAITILAPAAEDPEYRERARAQHNMGWAQLNKGDFAAARKTIQGVLRTHPTFCPAMHNLAMVDEAEAQLTQALQHYREALACSPKELNTILALGELEARLDLVPDACGHLRTVVAADPYGPMVEGAKKTIAELRCDGVSAL